MSEIRDFFNKLMTERASLQELNVVQSPRMFINNPQHIAQFVDAVLAAAEQSGIQMDTAKLMQAAKAAVDAGDVKLASNLDTNGFVRAVANEMNNRNAAPAAEPEKKPVNHDYSDNKAWVQARNKGLGRATSDREEFLRMKRDALRRTPTPEEKAAAQKASEVPSVSDTYEPKTMDAAVDAFKRAAWIKGIQNQRESVKKDAK